MEIKAPANTNLRTLLNQSHLRKHNSHPKKYWLIFLEKAIKIISLKIQRSKTIRDGIPLRNKKKIWFSLIHLFLIITSPSLHLHMKKVLTLKNNRKFLLRKVSVSSMTTMICQNNHLQFLNQVEIIFLEMIFSLALIFLHPHPLNQCQHKSNHKTHLKVEVERWKPILALIMSKIITMDRQFSKKIGIELTRNMRLKYQIGQVDLQWKTTSAFSFAL